MNGASLANNSQTIPDIFNDILKDLRSLDHSIAISAIRFLRLSGGKKGQREILQLTKRRLVKHGITVCTTPDARNGGKKMRGERIMLYTIPEELTNDPWNFTGRLSHGFDP